MSSHYFPTSKSSDETLAVNFIEDPLYKTGCFFLVVFKIQSFDNLIIMSLGVDLFESILVRVC